MVSSGAACSILASGDQQPTEEKPLPNRENTSFNGAHWSKRNMRFMVATPYTDVASKAVSSLRIFTAAGCGMVASFRSALDLICGAPGNLIGSGHLQAERKESFHHGRRQQDQRSGVVRSRIGCRRAGGDSLCSQERA